MERLFSEMKLSPPEDEIHDDDHKDQLPFVQRQDLLNLRTEFSSQIQLSHQQLSHQIQQLQNQIQMIMMNQNTIGIMLQSTGMQPVIKQPQNQSLQYNRDRAENGGGFELNSHHHCPREWNHPQDLGNQFPVSQPTSIVADQSAVGQGCSSVGGTPSSSVSASNSNTSLSMSADKLFVGRQSAFGQGNSSVGGVPSSLAFASNSNAGGNFSLGGGDEKSGRRFVKVKRDKIRRK